MGDGWNTHFIKVLKIISSYNVYQLSSVCHNICLTKQQAKQNPAQCLVSSILPYHSSLFFFLLLCRLDEIHFPSSIHIYYLKSIYSRSLPFSFLSHLLLLIIDHVFLLYSLLLTPFREPDLDQYSALIMDEAHER